MRVAQRLDANRLTRRDGALTCREPGERAAIRVVMLASGAAHLVPARISDAAGQHVDVSAQQRPGARATTTHQGRCRPVKAS